MCSMMAGGKGLLMQVFSGNQGTPGLSEADSSGSLGGSPGVEVMHTPVLIDLDTAPEHLGLVRLQQL